MKAQLEKISGSTQNSFKLFRYSKPQFDAPWHFHPEYELTYIVKSNGIRYVGDSVTEFEEGDFVLLGSNVPHCWKNVESQKENAESIVIQWNDDILGLGWQDKNEFAMVKNLLAASTRGVKFNREVTRRIKPVLFGMPKQSSFEKLISFLRILQLLALSGNQELLSGDNFTIKASLVESRNIDLVQNFVAKNYRNPMSLREVSNLVTMTEETFCRFFKRTFNKSFFTFVNEYKIKRACKLLIKSNDQVSEIAFESGYESLPFFYRQFKKFIGCTPLAYRKRYIKAFSG